MVRWLWRLRVRDDRVFHAFVTGMAAGALLLALLIVLAWRVKTGQWLW